MKKRVTALLLCLGLMSTMTVSAVSSDTSGLTPQMAKAYLNVVDQQVNNYGYTRTTDFPMDPGFAGGFVRDFDQNGIPEMYLLRYRTDYYDYATNAVEQIWTWDGKRVKLLFENDLSCYNYHDSESSAMHVLNGKTYFHVDSAGGTMGYYEGTGNVYSVQGTSWKTEMSYHYENHDGVPPGFGQQENVFYTEQNGKRTNYSSENALWAAVKQYKSTDYVELFVPGAGCVSIGFTPNGRTLRTQLSEIAANQPSSWAKAEVDAAKAAGLVPALTGDPGYRNSITRQQFAELVVALVEQAIGETLEAAPAETFSDCTNLAVRKASAAAIVNGMGDGLFAPNQTTNREQIATMVNRAIQYIKAETGTDLTPVKGSISKFADKSSVSSWAVEGVGALAANGIMNGTSSTQLSPKATCTVEQSILLSFRTFEKLP